MDYLQISNLPIMWLLCGVTVFISALQAKRQQRSHLFVCLEHVSSRRAEKHQNTAFCQKRTKILRDIDWSHRIDAQDILRRRVRGRHSRGVNDVHDFAKAGCILCAVPDRIFIRDIHAEGIDLRTIVFQFLFCRRKTCLATGAEQKRCLVGKALRAGESESGAAARDDAQFLFHKQVSLSYPSPAGSSFRRALCVR